jgi:hypothetical protein
MILRKSLNRGPESEYGRSGNLISFNQIQISAQGGACQVLKLAFFKKRRKFYDYVN